MVRLCRPTDRHGEIAGKYGYLENIMKRHPLKTVTIIATVVLTAIFLPGCQRETEQDKVRKVIKEVQRAAEEKDSRTILSHLSRTYHDPLGYDYDGIKGLLISYFFRHQKISIYLTNLEVTADAASARATFQAVLSARDKTGSAAGILPEALGVYAFDVVFSKESKEWKVSSAQWERLGDAPPERTQ
jgi:hypothetical protein